MKPNEVPFQPAAAAQFVQRLQNQGKDDPIPHCKATGVPAINNIPIPFKIVQTPGLINVLYEDSSVFRQIFLDARKPVEDAQPRWMGYSNGKWEGDTLVVDSVDFTEKSWLDRLGHTHSDAMRVTERFRRRDLGHLEIEVTIEDPKTYTRPINIRRKRRCFLTRISWNTSAQRMKRTFSTISEASGFYVGDVGSKVIELARRNWRSIDCFLVW
jgi:hypothetical protein